MTWNEQSPFADLFNASSSVPKMQLRVGERTQGIIIHLSRDTAFLSLDAKNEAMIPISELENPAIGQIIEATVSSFEDQIWLTLKGQKSAGPTGSLVEGKVTAANSGGVEVDLAGQKAFCPIGQLDIGYIEDPSQFIGKTLSFLVSQSSAKRLTLNRKALLLKDRQEKTKELLETLALGQRLELPVSRVADFGVFVDFGHGIEGLVPQSEIGYGKVSVGDRVLAEIIRIEPDPKRPGQARISLSLKAALPNPFEVYGNQLLSGAALVGTVSKIEGYGAFVTLFPGVDGLVHISELSQKRIRHPDEVVKLGDTVAVRILEADSSTKRISLTLKESDAENSAGAPMNSTKSLGTLGDLMIKSIA
ncbi:MAG: S1 RNA-binding domain-containing protein [Myxococcaceae bacterium]|nr:S1 RNA-binding domain-containing protein [Myxococcaceae bacterium]MBH2006305.1 S1 RNA-binding domain-containing protein [Myxococcaceae bacterium]